MPRFVLRNRSGASSDALRRRAQAAPDITVVEATPRMVLVDGREAAVRKLVADDDQWLMVREEGVPLPDARKKVRRPPRKPAPAR
jgi:hypothetical protein